MKGKIYRSRTIMHNNGETFETPLMVPSFSSKGFSFVKTKESVVSECHEVMLVAKEFLEESLLISAYDIFYRLIPLPDDFKSAKINFIDSGGYETSQIYDFSGINKFNHSVKPWNVEMLKQVVQQWPEDMTGIMVSYDHGELRQPIEEQRESAQNLFANSSLMSDFLIKPEKKNQSYIQLDKLLIKPEMLNGFDIIGVTEKEIGNSQWNRMINIAKLRKAMNEAGNNAPIHVFGSLDPINVILYFLAGAEIFDGLTWLKFAYHNGVATYIQNYNILSSKYGIETTDISLKRNFWVDNLNYLSKLKHTLMNFESDNNYSHFDDLDNGLFNLQAEIARVHDKFLNKIKSI